MIESVLNNREKVAEMPIFVMKLRRFIGRKGSDLNIDNKFFPHSLSGLIALTVCLFLNLFLVIVVPSEPVSIASVNCVLTINVQTVPSSVPISFHKEPFTDNS